MKTLLQINTNVGWNSTGRLAESIGRRAIDCGWSSFIGYGRQMQGAPQSASKLINIGNRKDILLHGLLTRVFDSHGTHSRDATVDFLKKIDQIEPDIIHLHNIHGYYLNYKELTSYLQRCGVPVVWTLHDTWAFTGHCAYFDLADCRRWEEGCHHCPMKREYPASLFADRSKRNFLEKLESFTALPDLHIVAVSNWLAETLKSSFLGGFPIEIIPNGIEIPAMPRVKRNPRLVLAAASKWDRNKGLDDVISLRELLPKSYQIKVIGLNKSQIRHLPSGIEGVGRISERGMLFSELASAAVFINTSRAETLSVANLEAQAAGTPVVVYHSGGMADTVTPETGHLIERGNVRKLAAAVKDIIQNPAGIRPQACRSFVAENFDLKNTLAQYIALYDTIMQEKRVIIERK